MKSGKLNGRPSDKGRKKNASELDILLLPSPRPPTRPTRPPALPALCPGGCPWAASPRLGPGEAWAERSADGVKVFVPLTPSCLVQVSSDRVLPLQNTAQNRWPGDPALSPASSGPGVEMASDGCWPQAPSPFLGPSPSRPSQGVSRLILIVLLPEGDTFSSLYPPL